MENMSQSIEIVSGNCVDVVSYFDLGMSNSVMTECVLRF
jgi:hypothetical protein